MRPFEPDEIRVGLQVEVPVNTSNSQFARAEVVWVSNDRRVVDVRRGKRQLRHSCAVSRMRRVSR